jgi:hypothetical protein
VKSINSEPKKKSLQIFEGFRISLEEEEDRSDEDSDQDEGGNSLSQSHAAARHHIFNPPQSSASRAQTQQ